MGLMGFHDSMRHAALERERQVQNAMTQLKSVDSINFSVELTLFSAQGLAVMTWSNAHIDPYVNGINYI